MTNTWQTMTNSHGTADLKNCRIENTCYRRNKLMNEKMYPVNWFCMCLCVHTCCMMTFSPMYQVVTTRVFTQPVNHLRAVVYQICRQRHRRTPFCPAPSHHQRILSILRRIVRLRRIRRLDLLHLSILEMNSYQETLTGGQTVLLELLQCMSACCGFPMGRVLFGVKILVSAWIFFYLVPRVLMFNGPVP